ncbi:hypothetical protein ABTM92_19845, partial [Acinetobacter baumannii]
VNLCQTFGLDESLVVPLAQLSALHPHEGLDRWEPRLHHLLKNEEFCRHVTSVAAKANQELTAYLKPLMPKNTDGAIMLCDAGWSG